MSNAPNAINGLRRSRREPPAVFVSVFFFLKQFRSVLRITTMSTDVPLPQPSSKPLKVSVTPGPDIEIIASDDPFTATVKVPVARVPVNQLNNPPKITATPPLSAATAVITPDSLPDDPAVLKRMIVELLATLAETRHEREQLQERLHLLLQRLYGPKTERFNPDQPLLFADIHQPAEAPAPPATDAGTIIEAPAQPTKRDRHGRKPLPENLPHVEEHHRLAEAELPCPACGTPRVEVGQETTTQLDYQPASLFIRDHIEHKYACPCCRQKGEAHFAAACKPKQPLGKGSPGAGLLAYIIVTKYFDHLPLYRQEGQFQRQGLQLSRSTTCDWMAECARCLEPLYQVMKGRVLQSPALWTDDTPVKLQGGDPDATKLSRLWGYLGDAQHPYNVFDFTVNRKRDGPQTFLKDYAGYLHADAFGGYDALYLPVTATGQARIHEVACNAHARRKFHDARGSDEARAHQGLAYYGQLYEIERQAKELPADVRLQMRQDLAVPVLEDFHTWLKKQEPQVVPKSKIAEAIHYALNQWQALCRYTTVGFLTIDNNVAEREMKQIAIGRKNWLFFGSPQGGKTAATLFSFTSTCRRLRVEPWAYLKDVLSRLPTTPAEQLSELLPDRWQAAQAAATST
jgi:transposase